MQTNKQRDDTSLFKMRYWIMTITWYVLLKVWTAAFFRVSHTYYTCKHTQSSWLTLVSSTSFPTALPSLCHHLNQSPAMSAPSWQDRYCLQRRCVLSISSHALPLHSPTLLQSCLLSRWKYCYKFHSINSKWMLEIMSSSVKYFKINNRRWTLTIFKPLVIKSKNKSIMDF